jgi:hypothetical protein
MSASVVLEGREERTLLSAWMLLLEVGKVVYIFIYDDVQVAGRLVRRDVSRRKALRHDCYESRKARRDVERDCYESRTRSQDKGAAPGHYIGLGDLSRSVSHASTPRQEVWGYAGRPTEPQIALFGVTTTAGM